MNLLRILAWALVMSAAVMAGPNVPAQALAALREIIGTATRLVRGKAQS